MTHPRSPALPFTVACVGIGLFSVMDALMKDLSIALGAYNAVLWRCLIGAALAGAVWAALRSPLPSREALGLHAVRSALVAAMAVSFFWALARLPLAEAIALSFIAPLITLYLAAVMLGEKVGRDAIIASLLGLAGMLVILSAKLGADGQVRDAMAVGAILFSAVAYAINLIIARKQAQVASPTEIAFFQNLLVGLILALAAPWGAVLPSAEWGPHLLGAALLATMSVFLLAWAYARAEAQQLVAVEYTAFLWAAALGWVWFGEALAWQTVAGTVLIVAGCIIAARKKPLVDRVEPLPA
ncbi:MAG: DMT family transporter [Sphingopyxis sp.]|nr:DMT family transporter [Sphingopyxis sp.]